MSVSVSESESACMQRKKTFCLECVLFVKKELQESMEGFLLTSSWGGHVFV